MPRGRRKTSTAPVCAVCQAANTKPVTGAISLCKLCEHAIQSPPKQCSNKGKCEVKSDASLASFCYLCRYQKAQADGIVQAAMGKADNDDEDEEKTATRENGEKRVRGRKNEDRDQKIAIILSHSRPRRRRTATHNMSFLEEDCCQVCGVDRDLKIYNDIELCHSCRTYIAEKVKMAQENCNYTLVCRYDGKCAISTETRPYCQACRYSKAAALGACKSLPLKSLGGKPGAAEARSDTEKSDGGLKSPPAVQRTGKLNVEQPRKAVATPAAKVESRANSTGSEKATITKSPPTSVAVANMKELLTDECCVCGGRGTISQSMCSACNTFVRRRNSSAVACAKGKLNCKIDPQTQNNCEGCRYHKAAKFGLTTPFLQIRRMDGSVLFDPETDDCSTKPPPPSKKPKLVPIPKQGATATTTTATPTATATTATATVQQGSSSTQLVAMQQPPQPIVIKPEVISPMQQQQPGGKPVTPVAQPVAPVDQPVAPVDQLVAPASKNTPHGQSGFKTFRQTTLGPSSWGKAQKGVQESAPQGLKQALSPKPAVEKGNDTSLANSGSATEPAKKKRGRPPKNAVIKSPGMESNPNTSAESIRKKPGPKPKTAVETSQGTIRKKPGPKSKTSIEKSPGIFSDPNTSAESIRKKPGPKSKTSIEKIPGIFSDPNTSAESPRKKPGPKSKTTVEKDTESSKPSTSKESKWKSGVEYSDSEDEIVEILQVSEEQEQSRKPGPKSHQAVQINVSTPIVGQYKPGPKSKKRARMESGDSVCGESPVKKPIFTAAAAAKLRNFAAGAALLQEAIEKPSSPKQNLFPTKPGPKSSKVCEVNLASSEEDMPVLVREVQRPGPKSSKLPAKESTAPESAVGQKARSRPGPKSFKEKQQNSEAPQETDDPSPVVFQKPGPKSRKQAGGKVQARQESASPVRSGKSHGSVNTSQTLETPPLRCGSASSVTSRGSLKSANVSQSLETPPPLKSPPVRRGSASSVTSKTSQKSTSQRLETPPLKTPPLKTPKQRTPLSASSVPSRGSQQNKPTPPQMPAPPRTAPKKPSPPQTAQATSTTTSLPLTCFTSSARGARGGGGTEEYVDELCCTVCSARNVAGVESQVREIFGVEICRDCEDFINRMAKTTEVFTCVKGLGRCRVTVETRHLCNFCRYMECVATGLPIKQRDNFRLVLGVPAAATVATPAVVAAENPVQAPGTPAEITHSTDNAGDLKRPRELAPSPSPHIDTKRPRLDEVPDPELQMAVQSEEEEEEIDVEGIDDALENEPVDPEYGEEEEEEEDGDYADDEEDDDQTEQEDELRLEDFEDILLGDDLRDDDDDDDDNDFEKEEEEGQERELDDDYNDSTTEEYDAGVAVPKITRGIAKKLNPPRAKRSSTEQSTIVSKGKKETKRKRKRKTKAFSPRRKPKSARKGQVSPGGSSTRTEFSRSETPEMPKLYQEGPLKINCDSSMTSEKESCFISPSVSSEMTMPMSSYRLRKSLTSNHSVTSQAESTLTESTPARSTSGRSTDGGGEQRWCIVCNDMKRVMFLTTTSFPLCRNCNDRIQKFNKMGTTLPMCLTGKMRCDSTRSGKQRDTCRYCRIHRILVAKTGEASGGITVAQLKREAAQRLRQREVATSTASTLSDCSSRKSPTKRSAPKPAPESPDPAAAKRLVIKLRPLILDASLEQQMKELMQKRNEAVTTEEEEEEDGDDGDDGSDVDVEGLDSSEPSPIVAHIEISPDEEEEEEEESEETTSGSICTSSQCSKTGSSNSTSGSGYSTTGMNESMSESPVISRQDTKAKKTVVSKSAAPVLYQSVGKQSMATAVNQSADTEGIRYAGSEVIRHADTEDYQSAVTEVIRYADTEVYRAASTEVYQSADTCTVVIQPLEVDIHQTVTAVANEQISPVVIEPKNSDGEPVDTSFCDSSPSNVTSHCEEHSETNCFRNQQSTTPDLLHLDLSLSRVEVDTPSQSLSPEAMEVEHAANRELSAEFYQNVSLEPSDIAEVSNIEPSDERSQNLGPKPAQIDQFVDRAESRKSCSPGPLRIDPSVSTLEHAQTDNSVDKNEHRQNPSQELLRIDPSPSVNTKESSRNPFPGLLRLDPSASTVTSEAATTSTCSDAPCPVSSSSVDSSRKRVEVACEESEAALRHREYALDWLHDDEGVCRCRGCGLGSASALAGVQHVIQNHCRCPHCDQEFMEVYMQRHHMAKVHQQSSERRRWQSEYSLRAAECIKSVDDCSVCSLCGEYFHFFLQARDHAQKLHVRMLPKFQCDACGAVFILQGSLEEHVCLREEKEDDELLRDGLSNVINRREGNKDEGDTEVDSRQGVVLVIQPRNNDDNDEDVDIDV